MFAKVDLEEWAHFKVNHTLDMCFQQPEFFPYNFDVLKYWQGCCYQL